MCRVIEWFSKLALHRHAFDFHQQTGVCQFGHPDGGPGAMPAWEQAVFHVTENCHVLAHVDVVGRHVHHVFEAATTLLQYFPQVSPGDDELRLGIFDHGQLRSAADLARALKSVANLYRWHVAGALDNGLHGGRNDQMAGGHSLYLFGPEAGV